MVTVAPTTQRMGSCTSCNTRNYSDYRSAPAYGPNGVQLYEMRVAPASGHCTSVTLWCAPCLQLLGQAIFPHRAGS